MIISSVFALKGNNVIMPNNLTEVPTTKIEENYYTNTSLKFLLEMENELINHKQGFYKTLLETDNTYIINEAFNDILIKAKEIIKKILAYIDSIIKRFITQIARIIGSDKYLSKMKDSIRKFSNDNSFEIDGYEFTISDTVPITDIIGLDLGELRDELRTVDNSDINTKMAKLSGIIAGLSDEGKIDDIRAQILGLTTPITEADYTNKIFTIFRDGRSDSFTLKIDREYVLKSLDGYFNYKSKQKEVKSLQSRISTKYKSLEHQIDDIVRSNMKINGDSTIDINIDSEKYSTNYKTNLKILLDNMINAQINQIQRIANLHVQAIAGKLDAYNALVLQDRNVLYRALQSVQKDINNSKIMKEYYELDLDPDTTNYDYTIEAVGKSYVQELYYLKLRHHRFIQECMCLSESNLEKLDSINEDLKMDTKNKFQKLIEFIKQIYQKFLMKMNKFFTNDDQFLKKYKDVILNKRTEEYTLNNMPDYQAGVKNIIAHKVKSIDIKSLIDKDEEYIKKQLLPDYKGGDNEYVEFAKKYFLYNNQNPIPEETKSSSLNMKELYDFCIGAKETVKVLEGDLRAFEQETAKVKTAVVNAANSSTTTKTNESFIPQKYYYSSVLERYVTEVEITKGNDDKENTNSDAKTNNKENNTKLDLTPSKPNHDNNENNKDLNKQVKNDTNGKDAEKQAEENKNSDIKKIEETANWFLSALRTVCTAKITAFQRIYSEYMKILRYHVKLATGDMGNTSNLKNEDIEEIQKAMINYIQNNNKEAATQKIKDIYKSKGMILDDHAVQNLVNKNKDKLEELAKNKPVSDNKEDNKG